MNKKLLQINRFFIVLSIIFFFSTCYDDKKLTDNSVSGRVILSGSGVPGIKMVLDSNDRPAFEVLSDSSGYFEFSQIWSGDYVLMPVDSTCNFDIEKVKIDLDEKNSTDNVFQIILSWQRFFGNDNNADSFELKDVCQTSDYGYLVTGSTDVNGNYRTFYWKFDQFGTLLWAKRLDEYDINLGIGCYEFDVDNYVIAGNLDGTDKTDIFVKTVNAFDGAINDSHLWSSPEAEYVSSVLCFDGRFYFSGMTTVNNGGTDGLVIRARYDLQDWTSEWNSQNNYSGLIITDSDEKIEIRRSGSFTANASTGIAAVGLKIKTVPVPGGFDSISSKIFIGLYDSGANRLAENSDIVYSANDEAIDVIQLESGEFLVAAQIDNDDGTLKNIMLVKYDSALNRVKDLRIGTNEEDYRVCSAIGCGDGTFMVSGTYREKGIRKVFLRKFDGELNEVWVKHFCFSSDQDSVPVKIIKTKDGGYMLAGYFTYLGKSKSFLLKLNRQCEVLNCNIDASIRDI
ncbi:MAG: carboxypeptidase regulatory-like domain-containing protein [Spirochaetes bacterium]|nr:carboxypeptidase regulatory-like domain-containing protein [Spirochaetota bacterium]